MGVVASVVIADVSKAGLACAVVNRPLAETAAGRPGGRWLCVPGVQILGRNNE